MLIPINTCTTMIWYNTYTIVEIFSDYDDDDSLF